MRTARPTSTRVLSVKGGCKQCPARWDAKNAQALAAQHYDRTRHPTYVEVTTRIEYGASATRQTNSAEKELF